MADSRYFRVSTRKSGAAATLPTTSCTAGWNASATLRQAELPV
jgi:hypothetical protein